MSIDKTYRRRFGLLLALLGACSTPSVPIPPPEVDVAALTFTSPNTGEVVLTGKPSTSSPSARFYIINLATGDGVIASAAADGSFTAPPLAANVDDTAEIFFDREGYPRSNSACVTVLVNAPLVKFDCP